MKKRWVVLMFVASAPALGQVANLEDPSQLVGKHVIVHRQALCVPGTFNARDETIAYSGKTAVVASATQKSLGPYSAHLNEAQLSRLPAQAQTTMRDQAKAAILTLQFEDGKKLDTCIEQGPILLSQNIELAPGETLSPAPSHTSDAVGNSGPSTSTPNPSCPASITAASSSSTNFGDMLAEALTTSEYERQTDSALHGGQGKHYLHFHWHNNSTQPILAIEAIATYEDVMGDVEGSMKMLSQNGKALPPGSEDRGTAMDREMWMENGKGFVTIHVNRIRFADGTFWTDNGSHSCAFRTEAK